MGREIENLARNFPWRHTHMGETTTRSELFEALTIAQSDCTLLAPTALASGGNIELTNEDPHRALRVWSPALHSQDTRDLCPPLPQGED